MSFSIDLNTLMTSDPSLNAYANGGIHYENLPENFEITKDWIVYSFNKSSQDFCLGSSPAITRYNVYIKIISTDTVRCEAMNDRTVAYLNGNTSGNIQDIRFVSDDHSVDLDKNIYMNSLNFEVLYA